MRIHREYPKIKNNQKINRTTHLPSPKKNNLSGTSKSIKKFKLDSIKLSKKTPDLSL